MTAAEAPTMPIKDKSARWMNLAMLALIAGALIAGVWITYQNVDAERVSREKAQASSKVLAELRDIYQATLRAETGQRGYMITLDRRYLAPYRVGRGEVLPAIGNLRALVGVDATPRQTALIAEIDLQANRKLDELDKTVAMLERGELLDARRLLLTDAGQEAMEALRVAIGEMAAIEQLELNDTLAATAQVQARTVPLLGVLLFLVFVFAIFGARLASRAARAEAEAAQAQTLAEAHDRADLLARELNHRVKNLFAVILAIIQMSGRGKPEAADLLQSISQRVRALLTAHEVTQGALDQPVASLRDLIETTLSPYVSQSQPVTLDGEPLVLPAKAATPLGLVLHELTTNTVKYGAWAQSGALQVSWHEDGEDIHIIWVETGCKNADQANSNGFGSLLMTSAARQLGGRIERSISAGGCEVTIVFPRALTTASA
jgi:two-component sensor histidine kinase/CHASE3 domain sensor protein